MQTSSKQNFSQNFFIDNSVHCPHFPKCGGCRYLQKPYSGQLQSKFGKMKSLFPNHLVKPIVSSPEQFYYRHKIQLPFAFDKKTGKPILGIHAHDKSEIVKQSDCLIQAPVLTSCVQSVMQWVNQEKISVYNVHTGQGELKYLIGRLSSNAQEVLLGLVTNSDNVLPKLKINSLVKKVEMDLARKKLSARLIGLMQNINPRKTTMALGYKNYLLYGRKYLLDTLANVSIQVELSTFVQVNPYATPLLYNIIAQEVPLRSHVLDIYSGMGSIALWVQERAQKILCIESNPASVKKGLEIVKNADLQHKIFFLKQQAAKGIQSIETGLFDVAIIDPPRIGAEENLLTSLKDIAIPKIIYVSCEPETLARDAKILSSHYSLESLQPVDMFPNTDQIETVALFKKTDTSFYNRRDHFQNKKKISIQKNKPEKIKK